jgi:cytochrome c2
VATPVLVFGHPEVYIIFLPPAGMVSMVLPTFGRTHLVGYTCIDMAAASTGFLNFGLSRYGPPSAAEAAQGRALVASGAYGCAACHSVPRVRSPRAIVGPDLTGFARRAFIAGQLPNTSDVLIEFLKNPPAFVPATGMPNVGLSLEDARRIAAFLYTME